MAVSSDSSTEEMKTCPWCYNNMPTLSFIAKSFSLSISDILNVYIVGSHVWGSCSRSSDWDLVIVTQKEGGHAINAHKNKLDAWILSLDDYVDFIKEHLLQALITVWLPKCFVLKETYNSKSCFKYSQSSLCASIHKMHQRDLRVAEKHFTKNDPKSGIKILRHCLRQMELSVQISTDHCIVDYTIASEEEQKLRQKGYKGCQMSWNEVMAIVGARMDTIMRLLQT